MKIYLVGGAVRDMLMGKEPKDRDWVVVGATKEDILNFEAQGYTWVGEDFPVLLHPKTGEEYALARTERKIGEGYLGFDCETEGVTLEEDLMRRDLTINAIAYDVENDEYIDPFEGRADIENGIIRHVSSAFAEDPVRILRVARFVARFGFEVAKPTLNLMKNMVQDGMVNELKRERVMQELVKSAEEAEMPSRFNGVLQQIGALSIVFPNLPKISDKQDICINRVVLENTKDKRVQNYIAAFLSHLDEVEMDVLQAQVVFPSKHFKFAKKLNLYQKDILPAVYGSLSAEETVDLLDSMNVRQNGGEQFLVDVHDYIVAANGIEPFIEDLVTIYDAFMSVDILPVIEAAKANGAPLNGLQIRALMRGLRIDALKQVEYE